MCYLHLDISLWGSRVVSTHPLWVIQCGNKVRLYPSCDPWAATVSPASSLTAVEADGIPGGDGVGSAPLSKGWQTTKSHATPEMPIVMILRDKVKLECESNLARGIQKTLYGKCRARGSRLYIASYLCLTLTAVHKDCACLARDAL